MSSLTQTEAWEAGPSHPTGSILCFERCAFLRTAFIIPGQRSLRAFNRNQSYLLATHQSQCFLSECTFVNRTAIIERSSAELGTKSSDLIWTQTQVFLEVVRNNFLSIWFQLQHDLVTSVHRCGGYPGHYTQSACWSDSMFPEQLLDHLEM